MAATIQSGGDWVAADAEQVDRYHRLADLTARVARAAAELEAARAGSGVLRPRDAAELEDLADRLQALHLLLANEVERAWNAAEAGARHARRAALLGQIHDAVSAETPLPPESAAGPWHDLGVGGLPEGPEDGLDTD